jgi:glycosyltransferase involved in cell wall biosynthesis
MPPDADGQCHAADQTGQSATSHSRPQPLNANGPLHLPWEPMGRIGGSVKITAIIAVRNEAEYIGNCLRYLCENGIYFAIIDHDSTDLTATHYSSTEFDKYRIGVWHMPYTGEFSLKDQIQKKMEVAGQIETEWLIHLDADEIIHSYQEEESLSHAIERMALTGATAINCDEFVFLPIDRDYSSSTDGFPDLHHYYFFEPSPHRLMRIWSKSSNLSSLEAGGHRLQGDDLRLAPESFALRHYMVRNQDHALRKYTERQFSRAEIEGGWHGQRINQPPQAFTFPPTEMLKHLPDIRAHDLDRSGPWNVHYWRRAR